MHGELSERILNGILTFTTLLLILTSPVADGRRNKGEAKHEVELNYPTPMPSFLPTESNYTYHKGERAILYCSIKNLGTKTIIWRRTNESTPLTIGEITYTDDKRYEIAHIEDSADWNLMISNVSTMETGSYECQISAVNRDLRKEIYLHVKDEFSYGEPHISVKGTLHVDRGMQIRLTCNASGAITPPDYIDWFKDGSKIMANKADKIELRKKLSINSRTITSVFTKAQATMHDAGTYVCRTSDLQVTDVKVNVLNTDKNSTKREPTDTMHVSFENAQSSSSSSSWSLSSHNAVLSASVIVCLKLLDSILRIFVSDER